MIKRLIIILLFIFFSFACTVKYFIVLGNRQKFFLPADTQILPITNENINFYQHIIDFDTTHQIPLNKILLLDSNLLFIGFAIYDTPQSIYKYLTSSLPILYKNKIQNKTLEYRIFYKKENYYCFSSIFKTKKTGFTIVMTLVNKDSTKVKQIFDNKNWLKNHLKK